MMNELALHCVNKHYKSNYALKDFTYTFHNGIYALLGPNGAGKSTLMNLIAAILSPDNGSEILWNGKDIKALGATYRRELGYMPQQQALYDNMTAWDFMGYIAAMKGFARQAEPMVKQKLQQVELENHMKQRIGGFSGGMKQRLLLASAMLGEPNLLVLDEPTAGLDPKQRVIVRKLLSQTAKKTIVLISTHIVSDVENICEEILMLREGHLIASGAIPALLSETQTDSLEELYLSYYGDKL